MVENKPKTDVFYDQFGDIKVQISMTYDYNTFGGDLYNISIRNKDTLKTLGHATIGMPYTDHITCDTIIKTYSLTSIEQNAFMNLLLPLMLKYMGSYQNKLMKF